MEFRRMRKSHAKQHVSTFLKYRAKIYCFPHFMEKSEIRLKWLVTHFSILSKNTSKSFVFFYSSWLHFNLRMDYWKNIQKIPCFAMFFFVIWSNMDEIQIIEQNRSIAVCTLSENFRKSPTNLRFCTFLKYCDKVHVFPFSGKLQNTP